MRLSYGEVYSRLVHILRLGRLACEDRHCLVSYGLVSYGLVSMGFVSYGPISKALST